MDDEQYLPNVADPRYNDRLKIILNMGHDGEPVVDILSSKSSGQATTPGQDSPAALFRRNVTAEDVRRLLGREVAVSMRGRTTARGVLFDVRAAELVVVDGAGRVAIPYSEIWAVRAQRVRTHGAIIAELAGRIATLESGRVEDLRRITDLEHRLDRLAN